MIEKIVNFLLEKQKNKGVLNDDAIPIFRYGYTILIEIMLNIIISIIVGVAVGEMGIVLLFNLFFIPLRGFCGGWHAEKSWICTVVSFVSLILVVLVSKYQLMNYYSVLWGFALSISVFVVFLKAPIIQVRMTYLVMQLQCTDLQLLEERIMFYFGILEIIV